MHSHCLVSVSRHNQHYHFISHLIFFCWILRDLDNVFFFSILPNFSKMFIFFYYSLYKVCCLRF